MSFHTSRLERQKIMHERVRRQTNSDVGKRHAGPAYLRKHAQSLMGTDFKNMVRQYYIHTLKHKKLSAKQPLEYEPMSEYGQLTKHRVATDKTFVDSDDEDTTTTKAPQRMCVTRAVDGHSRLLTIPVAAASVPEVVDPLLWPNISYGMVAQPSFFGGIPGVLAFCHICGESMPSDNIPVIRSHIFGGEIALHAECAVLKP